MPRYRSNIPITLILSADRPTQAELHVILILMVTDAIVGQAGWVGCC